MITFLSLNLAGSDKMEAEIYKPPQRCSFFYTSQQQCISMSQKLSPFIKNMEGAI